MAESIYHCLQRPIRKDGQGYTIENLLRSKELISSPFIGFLIFLLLGLGRASLQLSSAIF